MKLKRNWRVSKQLVEPYDELFDWVINGNYKIKIDKNKNEVYIPFTKETHNNVIYLGDIEYIGDYNQTINNFKNNKKIIGLNLVKYKPIKLKENDYDDVPF